MAALSTILGIGTELGANDDSDIVRAIRQGSVGNFNQFG